MTFQLTVLLVPFSAIALYAQPYAAVTQLTMPGGAAITPNAVNSSDLVAGQTDSAPVEGVVYQNGSVISLGPMGSDATSLAVATNDAGAVLLDSFAAPPPSGQQAGHTGIWQNGTLTPLSYSGATRLSGAGINAVGDVAGTAVLTRLGITAFLYKNGTFTRLNTMVGYTSSQASGINDQDQVSGLLISSTATHAALFSGGTITDLGVLPNGANSYATSINDAAQIAGYGDTGQPSSTVAIVWANGHATALGTLPGDQQSYAYSINGAGMVVGVSVNASGQSRAFLYQNGSMEDLNTLLPPGSGWQLCSAASVSSSGDIVGTGLYNGTPAGFLLRLP